MVDRTEERSQSRYGDDIRVKQGICTICFVLLCVIDQLKGSANGRVQFTASNCTGFIIAAIILTGCHWKDFMRIPHAVWTVLSVFGGYYAINWGIANNRHSGQWITAVLNVVVYGYLVLRLLLRIFVDKKRPRINWRFFILWAVMMLCMVFSKNDSVWPLWFLVMFGCFYLTEYTKEELNALFNGMLNGIIIGFVILQGFATMYRAFDEIRYAGMYTNGNMNALFYVFVQAAILGKWYQFKRNGAALGWRLLAGAGSGILIAYCFLTIGRTAMIVMLLNTVLLTVILFFQEEKRRFLNAAGRLAAVLLVAIISFPVVFFSVRRIPAEFYSAILLAGDAGSKIQGAVSLDDERYVEMDEFLEVALGRLFWFLHPSKEDARAETGISDVVGAILSPSLKVHAAEASPENDLTEKKPWGFGLTQDDPVLTEIEDMRNDVTVRWAIYSTYLGRLNFRGHKNSEDGVWVTDYYFAIHAHNFLIQVMFSYGILTGILFLETILCTFLYCLIQCLKKTKRSWFFIVGIFMITSFVGFGILEIDWRIGQLSFTSLFVVQYLLFYRYRGEGEEAEKAVSLPPRV